MNLSKFIKNLIIENLENCSTCGDDKKQLNEVDWSEFSDVSAKKMSVDETIVYLKKVIQDCNINDKSDRLSLDKPYIHTSRIPQKDGEIDIDHFIKNITQIPKEIISVNQKMEKSSNDDSIHVNIGIPALRGLVYDMDSNNFYIINTCPGAGSCAKICYARRGSYVMFPDVFVKQTRILNLLMNKPKLFKRILKHELEGIAMRNPDKEINFRWNDAGDFFAQTYFKIATEITSELKDFGYDINSYAYTKMGEIMNLSDSNIVLNYSNDANKKQTSLINNISDVKTSKIVPKSLFFDLFKINRDGRNYELDNQNKPIFKTPEGLQELKNRIVNTYNVDINTLLTYGEYMNKLKTVGIGKPNEFNVIVFPKGDGDISAKNSDVKITFLCYH